MNSMSVVAECEGYVLSKCQVTLLNWVNEFGVSEPIVQLQGGGRIIVQLPGVQDTAEAKRIIGRTANLEFRLEAQPDALVSMKEEFPFRGDVARGRATEIGRAHV